jgi:hypothetical protein
METAYYFLDSIKDRLFRKYSMDQLSKAVGINFGDELRNTMDEINANPEPDKAKGVIAELTDVKNITADNLSNEVSINLCR